MYTGTDEFTYVSKPEEQSFTLGDAFRSMNPIGMYLSRPDEIEGLDYERDPNFDFTTMEGFNSLSPRQIDWVAGARSEGDYYRRLQQSQEHDEIMQRFQADTNTITKYGKAFVAGSIDPTILIPYAGAVGKLNSALHTMSTAGRMRNTFIGAGTVGAVSNMASEALLEAQGAPVDYTSAALWGFGLGGTLPAIFEGVSRSQYQSRLADALTRDDLETGIKIDEMTFTQTKPDDFTPDIPKPLKSINNPTTGVVEPIKRGSKLWMASDVHKIWSSSIDAVRKFAMGADIPSVSTGSKIGTTTRDYNKILDGNIHKAQMDLYTGYRDAIADKSFKGTQEEYFEMLGREFRSLSAQQENLVIRDADYLKLKAEHKETLKKIKDEVGIKDEKYIKTKAQLDEALAKTRQELWSKNMPELPAHLKPVKEYFNKMLDEGQQVGVKDLDGISMDRLYITSQIDFHKAQAMDGKVLRDRIYEGLRGHADNDGIKDADLQIAANELATDWQKRGFDDKFNDPLYSGRTYLENKKTYGSRKLKIDRSKLLDVYNNNILDVMGGYHYFSRGQVAIRKAFPQLRDTYSVKTETNKDQHIEEVFKREFIDPIRQEAVAKGIDPKVEAEDIEAMRNVFQDLLGQSRLYTGRHPDMYRASRIAAQANSAALSGWFGINQMLEIPSALWATGFNRVLHKQFGQLMGQTIKALWNGKAPNLEFMNELVRTGYLSSLMQQNGINKIADTNSFFNMGKWENRLHNLNQKLYTYNGMRAMTSFLEAMVASNVVTLIRKGDKLDILQKFGLDAKDIKAINKELDRVGDIHPNGTINKLGIDEMKPEVKERLQVAMSRAIEEGVVQGDSMKLPNWMIIPGPLKQLVMQFMRFPIAANEILLRKGLTEDQAGMAASVAGAMMMSMGIRYIEEQARIGLGITEPSDAKYDLTTEEGLMNATLKSANYVAAFGGLSIPYQYATAITQHSLFEDSYVSSNVLSGTLGVTASRAQLGSDMLRMIIDGKYDSTKLWKGAHSFTPLYNFPLYHGAMTKLIEDETYDY